MQTKSLIAEHYCGNNSIQYQVIRIAHKRGDVTKLKDKKYVEQLREQIIKKYPKRFCDHMSGYHVKEDQSPLQQSIESIFLKSK